MDAKVVTAPTEGPWALCQHLRGIEEDSACPCGYRGVIYGPENDGFAVCQPGHDPEIAGQEGLGPQRYPRPVEIANSHLIVAACNSYQRHCPDPVSAAEGDLLGRCVEALRVLRPANLGRVPDSMRDDETLPVDMTIREIRMIDNLLSQVHPTEGAAS